MTEDNLCRQFGLLETDLESFLSPLLKEKMITSNPDLMLTPKGEETLARLWPVVEKTEQNILSSFTEEEKTGLVESLRRIQETAASLSNKSP
jgi:TrmH family RNA methyltransferase